jgi:hypothetical protein
VHRFGQRDQVLNLTAFVDEFCQACGDECAECLGFTLFVLFLASGGRLFVASLDSKDVDEAPFTDSCGSAFLLSAQFLFRNAAGLDVIDQRVELGVAIAERAQQCPGTAGHPPLEDHHRKPGRLAVEQAGLVVVVAYVGGCAVIEGLLAHGSLIERS